MWQYVRKKRQWIDEKENFPLHFFCFFMTSFSSKIIRNNRPIVLFTWTPSSWIRLNSFFFSNVNHSFDYTWSEIKLKYNLNCDRVVYLSLEYTFCWCVSWNTYAYLYKISARDINYFLKNIYCVDVFFLK